MSHYQPHVYCVTDIATGKLYIGSRTKTGTTLQNSETYFGSSKNREYLEGLRNRPVDFVRTVVGVCQSREEALILENRILAVIPKEEREKFYNKSFCTNGTLTFMPSKLSKEQKDKISITMSGRELSNEHRKALSNARKGRVPWNKGLPATEIHKQRLSVSHMGKIPPNKGTTMSDAQRVKISESLKRNKRGPSTIY
jgi:hypothetical protein